MQIRKNSFFEVRSSSIICSLYTLSESQEVLTILNLQSGISPNIKNDGSFSDDFLTFYKLINNPVIRGFSYYLIKPILGKKYVSLLSRNIAIKKIICKNTIPLKKYLRKFRYNYCRYFFSQNENFDNYPTEKEMNMYAIKSLFFLAGIE